MWKAKQQLGCNSSRATVIDNYVVAPTRERTHSTDMFILLLFAVVGTIGARAEVAQPSRMKLQRIEPT
jgi:hypothetical protein